MTANEKDLGLVGTKIGMTQIFDEDGDTVPVTVIQIGENIVTAVKTVETDGYNAIQVGNFSSNEKKLNKPQQGILKKNNLPLLKDLQEFRLHDELPELKVGEGINVEEFFKDLSKLNVSGTTIGKGFQGGVKLHNMSVGRRTHGSKSKRQLGSIGAGTTPGRVYKGKKMPSMMGNRKITVVKVKLVKYDPEKRVVLVRGPVPGKPGAVITLTASGHRAWNEFNKKSTAA